jgi:hypothetical protein
MAIGLFTQGKFFTDEENKNFGRYDAAVLVAYGVNVVWRAFLQSLVARQFHGVKLMTSDAHPDLCSSAKYEKRSG